jgi:signal transduction histidine kinase
MKKPSFFLLFIAFGVQTAVAQTSEIERLRTQLLMSKDSLRQVDLLNRMATLFYEVNIDSTFNLAKLAREISDRHDYQKGKTDAIKNLGISFDVRGNPQLALRYYFKAYEGYQAMKDHANSVQMQMNMAMVYQQTGNDPRAIELFNDALTQGAQLAKDSMLAPLLYNYLLMYPRHFGSDTTKYYLSKAKDIASRYKDHLVLLAVEQLEANELIEGGQRRQGIERLELAIQKAHKQKLYYASMDMMIGAGDQLLPDDTTRALSHYREALRIAEKQGYLSYSQEISRKLFDFYEGADYKQAAYYARLSLTLADRQREQENASGVDYMGYAIQESQLASAQRHLSDQRKLLLIGLMTLLMVIIILVLIRRNLLKSRYFNQQLVLKNRDLKDTLSALEHSHKENTRILRVVAHDLRSPVGAIYSLAGIMLSHSERQPDDMEILGLIRTSGANALQLVDDLLQAQFKTENIAKELLDISEVLKYCVTILKPRAEAKKQDLVLHVLPLEIPANREQLWRVISNLITNAIKFSPEAARIEVVAEKVADKVYIKIIDDGIGIPEKLKAGIFKLYSPSKREGTAGEKTYGMGLAISKQIVEGHGGCLWFEPNNPRGSVFIVELPLWQ